MSALPDGVMGHLGWPITRPVAKAWLAALVEDEMPKTPVPDHAPHWRPVLAALLCVAALAAWPTKAAAFKVKMHLRTANVAMYDAIDGAICLPGLTGPTTPQGQRPAQIPLGNTPLQHFWSEYNEQGQIQTSYRTWLLQYAPYVRAGAIGPDGFPDMIMGQLFVHANHTTPYDCEGLAEGECLDLRAVNEPAKGGPGAALKFGMEKLSALMQFAPSLPTSDKPQEEQESKLSLIKETFLGNPGWRSIDWGHEVLYRAQRYHDDRLLDAQGLPNKALSAQEREFYLEEKRAAVAFAMGYFMHMIGDGQIHGFINQLVAMPWSYTDTRTPDHPTYGPLSSLQEELQHMAMEGYISTLYSPGSEPLATMRHVDGLACEPFVPKDKIELQCIPDERLRPIQVEDCRLCNPLRSVNPAEVDSRCDHCYTRCNPWKTLCAPTLPGDGFICPEAELCPTLEAQLSDCKVQHKDKTQELNDCLRQRTMACTDAKESCACNKSVKVLKDMGLLPTDQIQFTCLSDQARKLSQEFTTYLQDAARIAQETLKDDTYTPEVRDALLRALDRGDCDTRPLDMRRVLGAGLIPDAPEPLQIKDENGMVVEDATYQAHGYVLDLNENGKPDLLNECILINCRLNPHTCPFSALDWELPDEQATDAIPCRVIPNEEGFEPLRYDANACDTGLFASTAIDVDVRKLVDAPRDSAIVEHFLNSNYMSVPKKFVADVFYMDRRYQSPPKRPSHEPDTRQEPTPRQPEDFAPTRPPGAFGTFSLGGYPVNAVHAMIDLLRLVSFYTQVSVTDVIGLARQLDANNQVFTYLDRLPQVIDQGVLHLRRMAKALRESRQLNFEFTIPLINKVVRVDLGQRLAAATLVIADHLAHVMPAMRDGADRMIAGLTSGLNRRAARLEKHIQTEWPDVTTCLAEFANSSEGRFYAIGRIKQFMGDAFNIMLTGATACTRPRLVDELLRGQFPQITWSSELADQMLQTQQWAVCQLESIILQRFYLGVLLPAFNKLFEETTKRYVCPIIGMDLDTGKDLLTHYFRSFAGQGTWLDHELQRLLGQTPSQGATLDQLCFEAAELLFNPVQLLNPLSEYALGQLDFTVGEDPELALRDYMRAMRMLSTGTCWDGDTSSVHIEDRDRLRAVYSDFAITTPDGAAPMCPDQYDVFTKLGLGEAKKAPTPNGRSLFLDDTDPTLDSDPVWGVLRQARAEEFALKRDPARPTDYQGQYDERPRITTSSGETITPYRAFMLPTAPNPDDPSVVPYVYTHDWEFDSRPGPPMVKTLDRQMNAPDPYSEPMHMQRFYDKRTREFSTRKVHLMNSVGFAPVYNTMQLNKLSFMGPGSPGVERCMFDEAQCQIDYPKDPARCEVLARECNPGSTGAKINDGMGVFGLITAGNKLSQAQLGSGKHGWRDPRDLFHDVEPIKSTGSKDEVLGAFFQEQYMSRHQPDVSHPGQRSCKSINYHPLCNSVYDLDDPDGYCRQAHAWAYRLMRGLPSLDPMMTRDVMQSRFGVVWPEIERETYLSELRRLMLASPFTEFWPKRSHDQCAWLVDTDAIKLRHYLLSLSTTPDKSSYMPDNTNVALIPKLRDRDLNREMRRDWDGSEAWGHADHAKDYVPTTRSFIMDTTRRVLAQDARPSAGADGSYQQAPSERSYIPTRFALANKDSHVARLYAKVMAPHYCPLSPDQADTDCDGIPDLCDSCPLIYNPEQQNSTSRGAWSHQGDACRGLDPMVQDLRCSAPVPPTPKPASGGANKGACDCATIPSATPPYATPFMLILVILLRAARRRRGGANQEPRR